MSPIWSHPQTNEQNHYPQLFNPAWKVEDGDFVLLFCGWEQIENTFWY